MLLVARPLLSASLGGLALLALFSLTALTASACDSFSAADAADPDAATDGGLASDAPSGSDPGAEAGDAAAALTFCASHGDAMLCADFDEGAPAIEHFTTLEGDASIVEGGAGSSPGALELQSPPAAFASYVVPSTATGSATEQKLSFSINIPSLDVLSTPTALDFAGITSGMGCQFNFQFFASAVRLDVTPNGFSPFFPFVLNMVPEPGMWTDVELVLTQAVGSVRATVLVNGAGTNVTSQDTACTTLVSAESVGSVYVGFNNATASSISTRATFDNVLFEQQ